MTPSNTPHRLAREATAAELADEAHKRISFSGFDDMLHAIIDRLASLALPQLQEQQRWMPISSAPKDGTPIIGFCQHSADAYYDGDRLTDYGARTEGLSHVEDGAHVLIWGESYEVSDGWENPSCTIPAGWELSHDCEVMANPTHWMPLPQFPKE